MAKRTDTEWAPWKLVEGDSKRWARVKVLETTIEIIEQGMRRNGFEPPEEP
jgi:polyphosphate kinase 2 (PPK2 family)